MSMNILAVLISLAMMLTGAGGEGMPAEAARTLVVSDVSLTYNGETVNLAPTLRIGASTDGAKAVYDVGVDLNGETLFPMQLGVDESGLTVLNKGNDVAMKISAQAFTALEEQMNTMMSDAMTSDPESAAIMSYLTDEYLPAYAGLLQAIQDPAFLEEIQATGNAIFAEKIDRGEGTPVTETVNGEEVTLTQYAYTIGSAEMGELADAIYTSNDTLKAYYDAMFKLYDMMPAESGLNGLHSFADMFTQMNLSMTLDVVEKVSDDGAIEIMDGTLTMDMNAMMQTMAAGQGADAAEVPQIDPIVMDIHAAKAGDEQNVTVNCDYESQGAGVRMAVEGHNVGTGAMEMTMNMGLSENGQDIGSMAVNATAMQDGESGSRTFGLTYSINTPEMSMGFNGTGIEEADGTGTSAFAINVNGDNLDASLSFSLDIVADEIEDLANGHEAAVTIDDLSDENMMNLSQDPNYKAAMMQIGGSLATDYLKMMADESVQQAATLFAAMQVPPVAEQAPEAYNYDDSTFEGEEEGDYEYPEVEDDGVLPFNQPEFTWMPEGWVLDSSEADTAYDWVNIAYTNEEGGAMYAYFYEDYADPVSYVVSDDGGIEAVEGRQITINDMGDGDLSVNMTENGANCTINFLGSNFDVETIGQIVAGIQF